MKRLLVTLGAAAFLLAPSQAQTLAPARTDMTTQEFRQVLLDLGSYLDSHRGTNLRGQFEAAPDDILAKLYPTVPNPRQLQSAVAALRAHDAAASVATAIPERSHRPGFQTESLPTATYPACSPNTIIDTSSGSTCGPAYPDPTNTAWQSLVNPLITFGAFSPTDYPDVATQGCSLTVSSNLSQVASALQGTVLAASSICSALPPIASNVCWGINAVFSIASATSFGLFSDCQSQGGNVSGAETDAAFHNTVTIYNALGSDFTALGTHLTSVDTDINTHLTNVDNDINTHLTTVNNTITGEFNAASTQLTNVNTQITAEFATLGSQLTEATDLLKAQLFQIMKLEMTPDGLKILNPAILTCTGSNCPNVLAACPKAGCSWNNVGPLP